MNPGRSPHGAPAPQVDPWDWPNPFATRFICPESTQFMFPEGQCAERLIERLEAAGWQGQIVGPHGSGKSTLLANLLPLIEQRGRRIFRYQLRDRQRSLANARADRRRWSPTSLVVVDGYEQLSYAWRWWLRRACRRAGCGLLITVHQAVGGPLLYRTQTSELLLQRLVVRLTEGYPAWAGLPLDQIQQAFAAQSGNLREALLQLYDVVEQSRVASRSSAASKPVSLSEFAESRPAD
jgi:energy-coupling factor transporter ATP-binding protein EcfA2